MTRSEGQVPSPGIVGIGLGPANLSLAALLEPLGRVEGLFCEATPWFSWHPGMMLPVSHVQIPYLKDLVTLVDPTSRFSFLNFLAEERRLHRFLFAELDRVSRIEYEQYYAWVCAQLDCCRFDTPVSTVKLRDRVFEVWARDTVIARTANIAVGTGQRPRVPSFARPLLDGNVIHSSDLLHMRPACSGKRVLIVGGGQSGAEVFAHIVANDRDLPEHITWVTSRDTFWPLDESPFVNEWFTPQYVEHFRSLAASRRSALLDAQHMASDGVTSSLLRRIYRRLYELDYLRDGPGLCTLLPAHRVIAAESRNGNHVGATILDVDTGERRELVVEVAIFATGYEVAIPACLDPILPLLEIADGELGLGPDYTIAWNGPRECRIFGQNMARSSHGIAEGNLALNSWRSAVIINAVCGEAVYDVSRADTALSWATSLESCSEAPTVGAVERDPT
jgi:lysine N6-hydroxylase